MLGARVVLETIVENGMPIRKEGAMECPETASILQKRKD